jgi:hypothetical protein
MPDRGRIDGLVTDLGRALGLDELALDESGRLRLKLDETEVDLAFDAEDDALWLTSDLGRIPDRFRDQTLARLLAANRDAPARGPAFAIDGDSGAVVMMTELLDAGLEYGDLETALLDHVSAGERWVGAIADGQAVAEPVERAGSAGFGGVIWG